MIQIKKFTFNMFAENTYVVSNDKSEAIIIDPGCSNEYEQTQLSEYIDKQGLNPIRLINTHCHIDHVLGNDFVREKYELKLEAHKNEIPVITRVHEYAAMFGQQIDKQNPPEIFIEDQATFYFGDTSFKALLAPGHSPGSLCFYFEKEKIVIAGDVLFKGSVGRYDLPGANGEDLYRSITEVIMALPDDVKVYSGHGSETTIGEERKSNPFINKQFFFGV